MLSCASNDVQLHRRASRPTGQASRRPTVKCQRDGVKLNLITGKLPVSSNQITGYVIKTVLTFLVRISATVRIGVRVGVRVSLVLLTCRFRIFALSHFCILYLPKAVTVE